MFFVVVSLSICTKKKKKKKKKKKIVSSLGKIVHCSRCCPANAFLVWRHNKIVYINYSFCTLHNAFPFLVLNQQNCELFSTHFSKNVFLVLELPGIVENSHYGVSPIADFVSFWFCSSGYIFVTW